MDYFLTKDTSIESARVQFSALKKLNPSQKLAMIFELSDNLREIKLAGLRLQHPSFNEKSLTKSFLKIILKKSIFEKIFSTEKYCA